MRAHASVFGAVAFTIVFAGAAASLRGVRGSSRSVVRPAVRASATATSGTDLTSLQGGEDAEHGGDVVRRVSRAGREAHRMLGQKVTERSIAYARRTLTRTIRRMPKPPGHGAISI